MKKQMLALLLASALISCKKNDNKPTEPEPAPPVVQPTPTDDTKSHFLGKKIVVLGQSEIDSLGNITRGKAQNYDTLVIAVDGSFASTLRVYHLDDVSEPLRADLSNATFVVNNVKRLTGTVSIDGANVTIVGSLLDGTYSFQKNDPTGGSQKFGQSYSLKKYSGKTTIVKSLKLL
jgi:hypothetical protein